jgi:hypothetical protein
MDGLTKEQSRRIRKHYIELAIKARARAKECEKYSQSWSFSQGALLAYRLAADGFKKFWPMILEAK